MSSTSSSECVCGDWYNYGQQRGCPGFVPGGSYYQTMGHQPNPLIYYAQVQQTPNYRRRGRVTKQESPNCFVKAFRWYTQEHYPPQSCELTRDRTDLTGFADWLDNKYDDFILEKRAEQNSFQIPPQRTPTLESNKNNNGVVCNLRIKNKFARMRSPWRKRRHSVSSGEAGDTVVDKCNQSFEFIMKPKELSRPASECHHSLQTRSRISYESLVSKKTITKSHSSVRTNIEKQNYTPYEVIKFEGNLPKVSKPALSKSETRPSQTLPKKEIKDAMCQCPEEKFETVDKGTMVDKEVLIGRPVIQPNDGENATTLVENKVLEISRAPSQVRAEDGSRPKRSRVSNGPFNRASETNISCQCSQIVTIKRDVHSQFVQDTTDAACCCEVSFVDYKPECQASSNQQTRPRMLMPAYAQHPQPQQLKLPAIIKDARPSLYEPVPKITDFVTFANDEAQTSDHSICLDKNRYPLFMKIICADKLHEEFIRK